MDDPGLKNPGTVHVRVSVPGPLDQLALEPRPLEDHRASYFSRKFSHKSFAYHSRSYSLRRLDIPHSPLNLHRNNWQGALHSPHSEGPLVK